MDYRRFDLNLLLVLDALLDERGVNATARRLGMSQPNVSFALAKLRKQFGDELLLRSGNRMQPTALGEALREPLRQVLEVLESSILAERHFDAKTSDRRFVISTSDVGELVFLPRLMAELAHRAPHVTLETRSMPPSQLHFAMGEGSVDLAIGYFPDLDGSNIVTQTLFGHPFVCIARADHSAAVEGWPLETFLGLSHIVVSPTGRSHELIEDYLAEQGLTRHVHLHSTHFMSVPLLVAQTDLISTVPSAVGAIFATMAPLRIIQPPFPSPLITIRQFWHGRVQDEPSVVWLRRLIAELFLGRDPSPKPVAEKT